MDELQLILNGLMLGGFYALLGLGMTMVLGIVGITNLAHGEFVVLGAYLSTLLAQAMNVDPLLTLLVSAPVMFLLGWVLQSGLINRVIFRGKEASLLVTFGISIILQDAMLLLFSADARHTVSSYGLLTLHLGPLDLSLINVLLMGVSLFFFLLFHLFLNRTYLGRAIRAVSDDPDAARLSGVRVNRVYAVALGISLVFAAVAGLCVGLKWTYYPNSGSHYLLISFIVVVIGGMGSVPGTLIAGLVFGLAQVIGGANYGLLISYVLLLGILAVRPKGLLGAG